MHHETFAMFAAYNEWANHRLYAAASQLGSDRWREDRGVFFRSMMGTLNHLLATDRIWLKRITGSGEAPDRLDAVLHEDFEPLRSARVSEDARLKACVASWTEADLAADFSYLRVTRPEPVSQPRWSALLHLFNHQTHHRGQAHAILTGFDLEAPGLDLVQFQRESGLGLR